MNKRPLFSKNAFTIWLMIALIALAFNLRSPLTAIPPIVNEIRSALHINATTAGLLTSIPILCFGILTPLASFIINRTSLKFSILMTLGGCILGTLIRASGSFGGLISGTIIIGMALTIGNIVSLLIIAKDFPHKSHIVTGLYTSALNIGTMLSSALTAPMAHYWGWQTALASWVDLALLALVLWVVIFYAEKSIASPSNDTLPSDQETAKATADILKGDNKTHNFFHRQLVQILVISFAAHLCVYYGLTAWIPSFLRQSNHMTSSQAGAAAAFFQILALLGSFGIPVLSQRFSSAFLLRVIGLCWLVTPVGLLWMPSLWLFWLVLGGFAAGGGFTVIFSTVIQFSRNLDDNRRISSAVQGVGYIFASASPLLIGFLHQSYGDWQWAFYFLSLASLPLFWTGFRLKKVEKFYSKKA
ncbi:CP family cyanate transporter-like MFS transporter [Zymomonas mobilis]|uniref:CP family cyanate transporter-like MFS transporter n=2 Tax=Zymomonas mobilis TaxID=542 RepID=A0A542W1R0_ZYMMB|nr:CP family cyanate transporter-like MFS transporter [Zymomonas mobilis]